MGVRVWRLALTASFVLAALTPGSPRAAPDDGICRGLKQYVAGEGKRPVDGTTLTYCANERDCRSRTFQVCCNGWRKDPDSKKLRCIKIDPSDSASIGAVDIATDVGNNEDSTGWTAVKREASLEDSVGRPRGLRSAPESNPAVKTGQSGGDAPDGQSVQRPEQASQNGSTDPAADGSGKAGSGAERGDQTVPPVAAGTAGRNASHSLIDANHSVGSPSTETSETHSEPNSTSRAANSGDGPHTSAGRPPSIGSADTSQEPSKDGSAPANGTSSQPEGPPHVVIRPASQNSATGDSAVSRSELESQAPTKKENNTEHRDTNLTTVAMAPVGSSVTTQSKTEALTSPLAQSSDNHASLNKSEAPTSPSGQSSYISASVNKSQVPATPPEQSGDNHTSVNKSQVPSTPPGQIGGNHESVKKSEALPSLSLRNGDNHGSVNKSEAPATPVAPSGDNHASVTATPVVQRGDNHASVTATPVVQSGDNHASVTATSVVQRGDNHESVTATSVVQRGDNHASVTATPVVQRGDNHASVTATSVVQRGENHASVTATPVAPIDDNHASVTATPVVQRGDNHASVTATPVVQRGDNHASANKILAATTSPRESGNNHGSANNSLVPATPLGQSGSNHANVSNSEALVSAKGQNDNNTSANNTGVNAPVQSEQNSSSTIQNPQDTSSLTLSSKDLAHGRYEEIVPSTESLQSTSAPPSPTSPANVPPSEGTASNAIGAAAAHPAQNGTSHDSVNTVPPVTAATPVTSHTGTTAATVGKPIAVPDAHHPNAQAGNTTVEYNVTVGNNHSSGNATPGAAAGKNSSVPTGQQGAASAANTTQKSGSGTSAANCTVAGQERNCTGANCSLPEHCNGTSHTDGLQTPPVVKPQPRGGSPVPSAAHTASEVTISLLLVAAVAFVAALLYWRTRRRRRRYINCGTREPNLHFSNPVYDLETMMEQTSLVKLQNAADIEDGDGDSSEHEATFQRK